MNYEPISIRIFRMSSAGSYYFEHGYFQILNEKHISLIITHNYHLHYSSAGLKNCMQCKHNLGYRQN